MRYVFCGLAAFSLLGATPSALAGEQEAIDGCIDKVREVGGPDARSGGEILSSDFSEAGTVVMLKDGGGTVWRCIGYNDGAVGELSVVEAADDGGGAMSGAQNEPTQSEVRVQFAAGTTGATYSHALGSSSAVSYLLGARDGQFLEVELRGNSEFLNYIIYVPGGDILYESSQAGYKYRGQLYKSGDHKVEVFYNGDVGTTGSYDIIFGIK